MAEGNQKIAVRFEPLGTLVEVALGTLLAEAAAEAGLVLQMPCGGEGLCGKCRVRLVQGTSEPSSEERRLFSPEELEAGWRLACQTAVDQPLIVEVQEGSLLRSTGPILVSGQALASFPLDPQVVKRFLILPPPTRQDDAPDLVRIGRALAESSCPSEQPMCPSPLQVPWHLVRQLPDRLRQSGFQGTAVLADDRLLDFELGDTTSEHYAVAVDIGTTTLAAALLHVPTGQDAAVVARLNPQTALGDDVISRIAYAQRGPDELDQLHQPVISAIDEMIGQLVQRVGIRREQIYQITLVGNTTMQHLLCRINPRYLGEVPFVPATGWGWSTEAGELGLEIHPAGLAYVAPVIGGYVGGDIVAGMVAAGLDQQEAPTLFLDIGTNGEIVLRAGGRLYAAATAAGPAFEGARIAHGMRATTGAIEKVSFDGQWHLRVIAGARAQGMCGSALIDLVAELLRLGVVRPNGRLVRPPDGPEEVRYRIQEFNGEPAFLICTPTESATGKAILLTQRDVRQLQLATGAIRAGIQLLLRRAGLQVLDVQNVFLAGGFGNYIRRRNAQRIGLLPPELPGERIRFLGNTALAGARVLALSRQARALAEHLARTTQHLDLATEPDFATTFAKAMIFPEYETCLT